MSLSEYQKSFHGEPEAFGKVAVLMGGQSGEREISLQSGNAVLESLRSVGVDCFGVDVGDEVLADLTRLKFDRAFIALHGKGGEDGRIQAVLESMKVPYTGSDYVASAIAMSKLVTKQICVACSLPTPDYRMLSESSDLAAVYSALGPEVFVKPSHEGSSLGMRCAKSVAELSKAFTYARQFDNEVLAERRVMGREFSVSIIGNCALPAIELVTKNDFYDYEAKYISDETRYICPSDLSPEKESEIRNLALAAFRAIRCKGWGRVDLMQDKNKNFYLIEVNTVPGLTNHSLVPMAANAVGLSFPELLLEILAQTLKKTQCKNG